MASQTADVPLLIAQVKTLTVEKLKQLLRSESLPLSGVKSELQIRIIAHIEKSRNAGDIIALNRIRSLVRGHPPPLNGGSYPSPYSRATPTASASPQFSSPNGHYSVDMSSFGSSKTTFKSSPFYTITRPLTQVYECKARESTRDTARLTVTLSQEVVENMRNDPSCRIMVFCAAEGLGPYTREPSDISFPHNVELKCNGDEVKANLRGLKNRPGSTRPADITSMIRTRPTGYPNSVEMVFALTTKAKSTPQKYFLVVNLVSKKSIDSMVHQIRHGRMISKEHIIREMRRKAEDPDEIVATSTVLSLKDPVGYTRITTPCRGIGCNHMQCFDAAYYLQLQEQAPTWTCPICNKAVPWEQLALDQYVNDILNATSKSVEAVTVEPNGTWMIQNQADNNSGRTSNPTPSDDDDDDDGDDDLVEIGNTSQFLAPKLEALTPHSVRTPPLSSREESSAPSASRPSASGNKRPRAVIDLTLSDDEDSRPTPKFPRLSDSASSDGIVSSSRSRPPSDRYYFHLPPPGPSPYNTDRFHPTL